MQTSTINLASLVAGVVMFFLPWVEFQCRGTAVLRQSGFEAATGNATIGRDLAKAHPGAVAKPTGGSGIKMALLTLASGIMLLFALKAAWTQYREGGGELSGTGALAGIALALVGIQMAVGFPVENALTDAMKSEAATNASEPLAAMVQQGVASGFRTKYLPCFYLYLAALAIPPAIWLGRTVASRRREAEGET